MFQCVLLIFILITFLQMMLNVFTRIWPCLYVYVYLQKCMVCMHTHTLNADEIIRLKQFRNFAVDSSQSPWFLYNKFTHSFSSLGMLELNVDRFYCSRVFKFDLDEQYLLLQNRQSPLNPQFSLQFECNIHLFCPILIVNRTVTIIGMCF